MARIDVFFLCDGHGCDAYKTKACENEQCKHTSDVEHAINKRLFTGMTKNEIMQAAILSDNFERLECVDRVAYCERGGKIIK